MCACIRLIQLLLYHLFKSVWMWFVVAVVNRCVIPMLIFRLIETLQLCSPWHGVNSLTQHTHAHTIRFSLHLVENILGNHVGNKKERQLLEYRKMQWHQNWYSCSFWFQCLLFIMNSIKCVRFGGWAYDRALKEPTKWRNERSISSCTMTLYGRSESDIWMSRQKSLRYTAPLQIWIVLCFFFYCELQCQWHLLILTR